MKFSSAHDQEFTQSTAQTYTPEPPPAPEPEQKKEMETQLNENTSLLTPKAGEHQSAVVQPPVIQEPEVDIVPTPRSEEKEVPAVAEDCYSMRDIELRAIFNTDENFTLRKVSQKVAAMEGIQACAIVTNDRVIEAYADQSCAIGDKIQSMSDHVRGLAEMSGIEGASYFTIHMDNAIMSFFFGKNNLLGVKHRSESFRPGTREKLILVARSLDSLEN